MNKETLVDYSKEVSQAEYEKIINECKDIDGYCAIENVFYIENPIKKLLVSFRKDFRLSYYCFQNFLISQSSIEYLINLFSKDTLYERFKWALLDFFIEASFQNSNFSSLFCQNSSAFNFILEGFSNHSKYKHHFKSIYNLIYNLVYDGYLNDISFFPVSYLTQLTFNIFHSATLDIKLTEKFSNFIMNFFRSYTSRCKLDIYDPSNKRLILNMRKWFEVPSEITFTHMLWGFYFWFKNTPVFTVVFYESYFFDIAMSFFKYDESEYEIKLPNRTCFNIILAMISMALSTRKDEYQHKMISNFPVEKVVELPFNFSGVVSNETKLLALNLCANYAASGSCFVDNLFNAELFKYILKSFTSFNYNFKIEAAYCVINSILVGNKDQISKFFDENFIELMYNSCQMDNKDLTIKTLNAFLAMFQLEPNLTGVIDHDEIADILNRNQSDEDISSVAQNLLSWFD